MKFQENCLAEDGLQLTKEDVAPRLRELTSRKDDLERELEDLERQLATKPIRIARDGVKRWVDFYEELFSDKSIAQKNLVQSLVTGVEIDSQKAVITYNPNLAHQSDTVDVEKQGVRMKRDWLGN